MRANRLAFLTNFGADCRDIEDLENAATRPPELGNLLVVFGHEEVDHLGHGSADALIRHVDREVERLARLMRKLHLWGYPEVHVVTDHGFILLDEDRLPPEVHCEKDWCYLRKERFALVPASADVPLATLPCQWNDQMRLAVPPGLAFFTAEKSFAHGGIALQELVIPHLVSHSQTPAKRLGVEVVLPTFELLRTAVKITLRPKPQGQSQPGQLALFAEPGRTLRLDVSRTEPAGTRQSVLAPGRSKEVRLEASSPEAQVTRFFHTALSFYDRIHAYIPGWEFQKTRDELYTNHFGLVTDYLAEVFRELRKSSYVDYVERAFRFGSHLGGRDQKAVRKIVSGFIKLLHPDGEVTKEEMEEYLAYAMEMRRRVKEQLKKMGGLEYWDTSFSYIDRDSGQETFVPVPEMDGGSLIIDGTLAPGGVYTIGTDVSNNRLALFLLQAQMNPGSGRIIPLGNLSNRMKEAIKTADAYLKANVRNLGIDRDLKGYDFSAQAINLNQAKEGAETAVAFFISMVSAILDKPVLDRTVVLGEMSVQGLLLKVNSLPERMQLAVEAGAKRILIPSENKRDLADVPDAILTAIQWQFYDSPTRAAIMAMGMN